MPFSKDFRVAIIGGGMCGLACAVALSRAGIQVDIYESASKFGEVGAGVGLGPNALRALDALGLMEAIMTKADQSTPTLRSFRFLSELPGHETIYDYPASERDVGLGIHRAAFLDALVGLIDPQTTHFNARCTAITPPSVSGSSRSVISFSDGTTAEADVIIGADGIRSVVRDAVIEGSGLKRLAFTNTVAYRALLPNESVKLSGVKTDLSERPACFVGVNKHIITFPIRNGQTINVVVFCTDRSLPVGSVEVPRDKWVVPATEQEILDVYNDSGPDVKTLLSLIQKPSKWSIHCVSPPLETYTKGNVVLVGDAAHGMCPHLGAGVGQGFEDVLVICQLLSHPDTNLTNIQSVLQAYDAVRRPRANMILERSTWAGELYESLQEGDSSSVIEQLRTELVDLWDPVWHHDIQADIGIAVQQLKEEGAFK
ncbi:FAD/NAD(P)-binding domain-containing protein [Leucogyrophana mollusca]|uniref:FAD/NAD(P)-binding domain-containing protein n=1 Tax=Leucogyrophana mollusca TaxID=85980 RepID=A0ACB8BGH1_9AGAM|nr:FAD/NAD(P)-binding domain-containing protein [Leucogyrophana mollusca]